MNKMEPLTSAELLAVLRLAKQESPRDHAMLLICYGHAMRAHECGEMLLSECLRSGLDNSRSPWQRFAANHREAHAQQQPVTR